MEIISVFEFNGIKLVKDQDGKLYSLQPIVETKLITGKENESTNNENQDNKKKESNNFVENDTGKATPTSCNDSATSPQSAELKYKIANTLIDLGIVQNSNPYYHLIDSIYLLIKNPNYIVDFNKTIYLSVAQMYKIRPTSVAWGINRTLSSSLNKSKYLEMFPEATEEITPKGFIITLANYFNKQ